MKLSSTISFSDELGGASAAGRDDDVLSSVGGVSVFCVP